MTLLAADSAPPPEFLAIFAGFFLVMGLFVLAWVAFAIFCWWRVFARAGYPGALAFLLLVPLGSMILPIILAFGRWPILEELQQLRQREGLPPEGGG